MTRPAPSQDEERPLDPAVENVRRKLVRFIAINLGLLFVALMAVVGALVYKSRTVSPLAPESTAELPAPGTVIEAEIALPAGARIVSQALSGDRLSLALELPGGGRAIYLYDIGQRRIVGRFAVTEQ